MTHRFERFRISFADGLIILQFLIVVDPGENVLAGIAHNVIQKLYQPFEFNFTTCRRCSTLKAFEHSIRERVQ